jgi:hypothetical protein
LRFEYGQREKDVWFITEQNKTEWQIKVKPKKCGEKDYF